MFQKITKIKILLFLLNCVILTVSILMIISGVVIVGDITSFAYFIKHEIILSSYLFLSIAFLSLFTSIFAFYVMFSSNCNKSLVIYVLLLLLLLASHLSIVAFSLFTKNTLSHELMQSMRKSFGNYSFVEKDKTEWQNMQRKIGCCGMNGPSDWNAVFAKNQVPSSCCTRTSLTSSNDLCWNGNDPSFNVHQTSCYEIVYTKITDHCSSIILICFLTALIKVITIITSIYLFIVTSRENSISSLPRESD